MIGRPGEPARDGVGGPLHGLLVVAVEQAVAAPLATRQLADLGARVVKVERPGVGDFARNYDSAVLGQSSYFVWLNRGKQSLELDIKALEDRAVLESLLGRADVLVQNLAPGALDRLGFGSSVLRARYPRLITCSISGYGTSGPYGGKKAYDLLIQCEAGLLDVTGTDSEPAKAGIPAADIAAGMFAFSGVMTALYQRERTGLGTDVDVSMLDALSEWMAEAGYYSQYGSRLHRTGPRHASIAPYGPYVAGDGSTVFIGVQNDREWAVFCEYVLEEPRYATDARFADNVRRHENNDVLTDLITAAVSRFDAATLIDLLDRHGIANARLRGAREVLTHPQHLARGRVRQVETPSGPITALLPPVVLAGQEAQMGRVPALGEHNALLRRELREGTRAGS
jgi:itaconate CoA-transferase